VCVGAMTKCPFGLAPSTLTVLPSTILHTMGPMGHCSNCVPFMNIAPFGLCTSLLNPVTAAQTAAALGVLTPGTCIPTPVGPWIPTKPTVLGPMGPMLTNGSSLMCAFGGCIKIIMPVQFNVSI